MRSRLFLFSLGACLGALAFGGNVPGQEPRTVSKLTAKAGDRIVAEVIVDTHDAPDLADWGQRAGKLCLEWFPKLAELLPSEGFEAPTKVTLVFDPKMEGVAAAQGDRIRIAAAWVRAHPEDFGMVIHELTHVVQQYGGKGEGWLTEGIADYIRYWRFEPGTKEVKIDRVRNSYRQGYAVAGAFLDWLEREKHPGIVVKLNAASRTGGYRESLFEDLCGKKLQELWEEFASRPQP